MTDQRELRLERMPLADLPRLETLSHIDRLFLTRTPVSDLSGGGRTLTVNVQTCPDPGVSFGAAPHTTR